MKGIGDTIKIYQLKKIKSQERRENTRFLSEKYFFMDSW